MMVPLPCSVPPLPLAVISTTAGWACCTAASTLCSRVAALLLGCAPVVVVVVMLSPPGVVLVDAAPVCDISPAISVAMKRINLTNIILYPCLPPIPSSEEKIGACQRWMQEDHAAR